MVAGRLFLTHHLTLIYGWLETYKSESLIPSHLHFFVQYKFVNLQLIYLFIILMYELLLLIISREPPNFSSLSEKVQDQDSHLAGLHVPK